jgi:Protein of unknown function (DUF1553)/Protein of unknown function (DUF1549)/Concanavalin A-like lectin/glucanases superfamily/Planctomycete cytochrome C
MRRFLYVLVSTATIATVVVANEPEFDKRVAPILAGRCLECHSGPEPKGKLDLSSEKLAKAGGESGAAIVANNLDESLLWQRIAAGEMPPKHPLPAAERALLKDWIASGAKWGTDPIDPFRFTTTTRAGYDWWSLQPLVRPAVPKINNPISKIQNPIDAFILAKLEAAGLAPSPPADARTLVRRLYFDLIGLPPSFDELSGVAPTPPLSLSPAREKEWESGRGEEWEKKYATLVEDLLASTHYGERWARHWLDVAHFGESDGYEYDRMRPHAWRYRDWVIDALNRDLPYDEFNRLQIAGDVLQPGNHGALIATGFLVGGAHDSLLPKGEVMQKIMRQDELEDLVSLVSQTFLGLTVNCARCHDHKFDPVRQTDYYRLAAGLAGVKRGNRDIPLTPTAELVAAHKQAVAELEAISRPAKAAVLAKRKAEIAAGPQPPEPLAQWEFNDDARDEKNNLPGMLLGNAKVEKGALTVDGRSMHVATAPLTADLTEKTLEAWVRLSHLQQRSGGVIGVETLDGKTFDCIVYGEREAKRWIAGSNNFQRTKSIENAVDESDADSRFVHLAAVYYADGQIQLFRDGQSYGKPYASEGPVRFAAGKSRVVFGMRHSPPGGNKMLDGRIDRARLYDRALSPAEIAASAGAVDTSVSDAELLAEVAEPAKTRFTALQAEVARLSAKLEEHRDRKAYAVTPQAAPVVHLLVRGNAQQPGEVIVPAGIAALGASEPDLGLAADAPDAERRTKLAAWIASEKNPLFARTIVNRVWQHHFGRGLVETPNDLGFSGGQPSHPELLDWLATELIERKWSLKALHKLIVTSATYRQGSGFRVQDSKPSALNPEPRTLNPFLLDTDNRLLWRFSPRRLEAECVRDAMLSVAGQLNPEAGGPSYFDFKPFVYKTTQYYDPIDPIGPEFSRRSIYRFWARGGKNPLLDTFDCPDPSTTAPRRASTTTPLQALALFNNSFTLRMADHFAERLCRECSGDLAKQVQRAFELAYGRSPLATEQDESTAFAREHGLAAFCRVLLNTNGFLYVN